MSTGIVAEAKSTSFEDVPNLGPTEGPVSNEGRGVTAVAESGRSAGGGRWGRWLLEAAGRGFNPDAVFGRLPTSDLWWEEPLVGRRAVLGNGRDASARSEMLGGTGAAAVVRGLHKNTTRGSDRTMHQVRGKAILSRRLLMRIAVFIRRRLHFAPRGLRVIEVVARPRVAGLANPDPSERAVTGGGKAEREAGTKPEGAEQKPNR